MSPFAVLGIEPDTPKPEAKARYRELVKRHHPDLGGDEETFKRIQAAWAALKNLRPAPPPQMNQHVVIIQMHSEPGATTTYHRGGVSFTVKF